VCSSGLQRQPANHQAMSAQEQLQQMLMHQMMAQQGGQMTPELPEELSISLTPSVDKRVRYLRNVQHEHAKLQAEFRKAYHALEVQWAAKFNAIYEKRAACVTGTYEPKDDEAVWKHDEEEDEEGNKVEPELAPEPTPALTGIPNFWLNALYHDPSINEVIEEHDLAVLKFLKDIKCELLDGERKGFRLSFAFDKNEFFTNDVLTKTFDFDFDVEEGSDHFDFETVSGAEGTIINWNEGKNTCEQQIKKKQRKKGGKGAGKTRTVFKTVPQRSFFHLFAGGDWEDEEQEEGDDGSQPVVDGLAFGDAATQIKEEVIPNALLFALGENDAYGQEDYDDYDEEDEEYDEDDENAPGAIEELHEDDEDEEEEEEKPKGKGGKSRGGAGGHGHSHGGGHGHSHGGAGGGHGHSHGGPAAGGEKPPECKQS